MHYTSVLCPQWNEEWKEKATTGEAQSERRTRKPEAKTNFSRVFSTLFLRLQHYQQISSALQFLCKSYCFTASEASLDELPEQAVSHGDHNHIRCALRMKNSASLASLTEIFPRSIPTMGCLFSLTNIFSENSSKRGRGSEVKAP